MFYLIRDLSTLFFRRRLVNLDGAIDLANDPVTGEEAN
jgi:hypothetical protein